MTLFVSMILLLLESQAHCCYASVVPLLAELVARSMFVDRGYSVTRLHVNCGGILLPSNLSTKAKDSSTHSYYFYVLVECPNKYI